MNTLLTPCVYHLHLGLWWSRILVRWLSYTWPTFNHLGMIMMTATTVLFSWRCLASALGLESGYWMWISRIRMDLYLLSLTLTTFDHDWLILLFVLSIRFSFSGLPLYVLRTNSAPSTTVPYNIPHLHVIFDSVWTVSSLGALSRPRRSWKEDLGVLARDPMNTKWTHCMAITVLIVVEIASGVNMSLTVGVRETCNHSI